MELFEPVLELSLHVSRLTLHGGFHEPNVIVAVETSSGTHNRWIPHSQTEAVQSRKDCNFLKTISFFPKDNIDRATKLQFIFKRLRKNDQTEAIGSAFCCVETVLSNLKANTNLALTLNGSPVGSVQIKLVNLSTRLHKHMAQQQQQNPVSIGNSQPSLEEMSCLSRNAFFKHLLINPINRTYHCLNCHNDDITIYEYMLETPLSFQMPLQYLEMCRRETLHAIGMLENMGDLKSELESQRVSMLNKCREHLIQYKARIDSMKNYRKDSRHCIKKSADKTSEELEFVPINLHVQHMRVHRKKVLQKHKNHVSTTTAPAGEDHVINDNHDIIPMPEASDIHGATNDKSAAADHPGEMYEYSFVTVGAAAAHSKGFKQGGGLLNLLASHRTDGSSKNSRKTVMTDDQLNKVLEYGGLADRRKIAIIEQEVKGYCDELSALLTDLKTKINNPTLQLQQFDILDKISAKVSKFIGCCDNSDLSKAHDLMQSNMKPSSISSPRDSESRWEDLKLKVKSSLALLIKSIHQNQQLVETDQTGTDGNIAETTLILVQTVETSIRELHVEVERALFHHQFIKCSSVEFYSDNFYRRRIVFSQALSMCACGVASLILKAASENGYHILEQYDKCGFLLQVESLLSTYGSETGMIQDYIIGVMDLQKLSVKFEKKIAGAEQGWSPSLLTGSTLKLVLKIFLDESSFNQLPPRLKQGGLMSIHPTFFNVGINQEQTLAEKFGDTVTQDYINRDSFQRLIDYHEKVAQFSPQTIHNYPKRPTASSHQSNNNPPNATTSHAAGFLPRVRHTLSQGVLSHTSHNVTLDRATNGKTTYEVLDKIRTALNANKNKPVEILQLTAEICRRLNGLRVTSCKSAKDRTAMSVTLEQASILMQEQDIEEKTFYSVLSAMRSNGTRLENTMKNVGQRKYAFASVQLMTFPKLYRPPDGTYGKVES